MTLHQSTPVSAQGVFINNQWWPSDSGNTIEVVAPADGKIFASIAAGNGTDVDRAVKAARAAVDGGAWGRLSATDRGRLFEQAFPCHR
jgi:aldehyde dehydrogenase (NAD+)